MAASKRQGAKQPAPTPAVETNPAWRLWQIAAIVLGSLIVLFEVYSPSLDGPFLLDDGYQFFGRPDVGFMTLTHWLNNVRPLLNLSFYINYQLSGTATTSYHAVNVLLHWVNALLCFIILRRLLRAASPDLEPGWRADVGPLAAAALFLLHPIQTESVAYISSRSELLSVLPAYAALLVFLARPEPAISWARAAVVIVLFGAAVLSKEHAAALPAVLILADLFFHPDGPLRGIKSNWKLYAPLVAAAALGLSFVWKTLNTTTSAGFRLPGLAWYEYFFTQWRMFWNYLLLVVLPVGQNADPDVALSRTAFEHGAIFAGVAILALIAAAFFYRRRFPLAAFGILTFIVLLAPTSSIVPIRDLFAERRLYLPMIGLLCVTLEGLRHLNTRQTGTFVALTAVLLGASYLTWQRAHVWSGGIPLWADTVAKSPNKYRPRFQYAFALYQDHRCTEAAEQYEKTAALDPHPGERLFVDWALALDCAGRLDEAAAKLEQASRAIPSVVVYVNLAMIYGKTGRNDEALAVLDKAERINPRFAQVHAFRGNIYFSQQKPQAAAESYRKALQFDPANQAAIHGLRALGAQ